MSGHGHAHNTSKVVVSIVVAVASLGTGPRRHSLCPHVVAGMAASRDPKRKAYGPGGPGLGHGGPAAPEVKTGFVD